MNFVGFGIFFAPCDARLTPTASLFARTGAGFLVTNHRFLPSASGLPMNPLRLTNSALTVAYPPKSTSTTMHVKLILAGLAIALTFIGGPVSDGAVMITMEESGSDVTATLTGSITNWTGATLTVGTTQTGGILNRVTPSDTALLFVNGPSLGAGTSLTRYSVPTYPTSLGLGTATVNASSSTASTVLYILGRELDNFFIADSYALNTPITGVLTWQNQTFEDMGLAQGSYVWSWGDPSTPGQGDKITLNIVPEPTTYAMALAGLACGGYFVRRRRSRSPHARLAATSLALAGVCLCTTNAHAVTIE